MPESLICLARQAPKTKIFLFFRNANHCNNLSVPPDKRGARDVTNVRWDAVDVKLAKDDRRRSRTAKSCGPDAPMAGVKFARSSRFLRATVTSKLWSRRGEHGISCKTIAQGRPDCFR